MMNIIITVAAMAACLVSLWRSVHPRSQRFDRVFFAIVAVVFLIIGTFFNNSL